MIQLAAQGGKERMKRARVGAKNTTQKIINTSPSESMLEIAMETVGQTKMALIYDIGNRDLAL